MSTREKLVSKTLIPTGDVFPNQKKSENQMEKQPLGGYVPIPGNCKLLHVTSHRSPPGSVKFSAETPQALHANARRAVDRMGAGPNERPTHAFD